jgi:hypothetical protein
MVATQLPVNGFLGTGVPFAADVNLIVQLAMGEALIAGVILAKKKRYRAHGACQTTVLLLNLWMIGFEMWPSFRLQVMQMRGPTINGIKSPRRRVARPQHAFTIRFDSAGTARIATIAITKLA